MSLHNSKRTGRVDFQEKRENAMRPSRYLGYDHDELGVYFLDREALPLAEAEFRRAVWLNPYEYRFRLHVVACLMRQKKMGEALAAVQEIRAGWPEEAEPERILRMIAQDASQPRQARPPIPPCPPTA